jgi:hypothetical protein
VPSEERGELDEDASEDVFELPREDVNLDLERAARIRLRDDGEPLSAYFLCISEDVTR